MRFVLEVYRLELCAWAEFADSLVALVLAKSTAGAALCAGSLVALVHADSRVGASFSADLLLAIAHAKSRASSALCAAPLFAIVLAVFPAARRTSTDLAP